MSGNMDLESIARVLKAAPGVSGWALHARQVESHQLYRVFRNEQARRVAHTHSVRVTVHTRKQEGGKESQGEAAFTLTGPRPELTPAQVAVAVERAKLVANAPWALPGPASLPQVPLEDPRVAAEPDAVIAELVTEMDAAAGDAPLCASELFADRVQTTVCTSEGFEGSYGATELFSEFVLLADNGTDSVEVQGIRRARRARELDLGAVVGRHASWAGDRLIATLPTGGTLPVVFGEESLDTLFDTFLAHAGGRSRYEGWSRLSEGKPLIEALSGDPITLTVDPLAPWMLGSQPMDSDGQIAHKVTVVDQGRFVERTASKRFADYLGIRATGASGNTVVAPGSTPLADLLAHGPVLHALRFSTFHPSSVTGAFSGELRTAYLHLPDGSVRPVVGGSVSGDVWHAFARATLSAEETVRGGYRGPAGIRLEGVTVAGAT
ncbi:MAG: metallopeptidase TldD-related protein [Nitrospirota bacterium]|nr:metallopeptidase TldD-related protein [Nitrospirota bacterium]